MKIRFLNFGLGFSSSSSRMQGFSNVTYGGLSRWNGVHLAQEVIVDVPDEAEYLRIIQDLKAAYDMPLRRWVPIPDFPKAAKRSGNPRARNDRKSEKAEHPTSNTQHPTSNS